MKLHGSVAVHWLSPEERTKLDIERHSLTHISVYDEEFSLIIGNNS